jgi:hypothetical protein
MPRMDIFHQPPNRTQSLQQKSHQLTTGPNGVCARNLEKQSIAAECRRGMPRSSRHLPVWRAQIVRIGTATQRRRGSAASSALPSPGQWRQGRGCSQCGGAPNTRRRQRSDPGTAPNSPPLAWMLVLTQVYPQAISPYCKCAVQRSGYACCAQVNRRRFIPVTRIDS